MVEPIGKYLENWGVFQQDLDYTFLSRFLYFLILKKFRVLVDPVEYPYLWEYQNRVFDLIEDLRTLSEERIFNILEYLFDKDPYLTDILIILWPFPRVGLLSQTSFQEEYAQNILKYHQLLVNLLEKNTSFQRIIGSFCADIFSKDHAYLPIHSIDILWYYLKWLPVDLVLHDHKDYYLQVRNNDQPEEPLIISFNPKIYQQLGLHGPVTNYLSYN